MDTYRVYADDNVVFQDDFDEEDSVTPYCDDYGTYEVTEEFLKTFDSYPPALIHDLLERHPSAFITIRTYKET